MPKHRSWNSRTSSSAIYFIQDDSEPADPPANADQVSYIQVCTNAKQQRQHHAPGQCPYDMQILYKFWSHFLLRNFNTKMYQDFKFFASEDFINGSSFGMDYLLEFYEKALFCDDRVVRRKVARDFVDSAKIENGRVEQPTFRKLRTAWRNGEMNFRSRKILQEMMDFELKSAVDG